MEHQVERARYEAQRAERRYRAVDPDNRLVARGLEAEWEEALRAVAPPKPSSSAVSATGREPSLTTSAAQSSRWDRIVERVWSAPTTTDRDRKELLRTLLEEVIIAVDREGSRRI